MADDHRARMTPGNPPAPLSEDVCSDDSFSLSADTFKSVFRGHPGGVSLITADAGDGPAALTATSVSPVSAHPPLLMFSLSAQSSSSPTIKAAATVVVHLLNAENLRLANLGATSGIDRFADADAWTRLPTGEPLFVEASTWIRARILSRIDAAGSTVILAQALEGSSRESRPGGPPTVDGLVYVNRTWHRIGSHTRID